MAFNSLIFIIFFAIVFGLHRLPLQWRAKKANLLLASYVFYAAWNPPFIVLLWISTLTDWFAAKRIAVTRNGRKRFYLILSIAINLGLLGYFKYRAFIEDNLAAILSTAGISYAPAYGDIILPLGISFYTFQSMSYSIDVYRAKIPPHDSFLDFALYVTFFPQLVAGPILRAGFFLKQLAEENREKVAQVGWGLAIATIGMFEKVVLADGALAPVVERVYGEAAAANGTDAWIGTVAFAGQIFFDFNGYSMIAVGCAKCLGFELPWNFLSPYGAIGFSDFWRRWHITLSTWLRDYLYIPLSGNRAGTARTIVNLMLTMLLGGLWHGASWLFVLWGAVHGLLLVIERALRAMFENSLLVRTAGARLILGALTWLAVTLAWVLFRAEDPGSAAHLLGAMLTFGGGDPLLDGRQALTVIIVVAGLLAAHAHMRNRRFEQVFGSLSWPVAGLILGAMLIAIVLSPGEERDFIYFEF